MVGMTSSSLPHVVPIAAGPPPNARSVLVRPPPVGIFHLHPRDSSRPRGPQAIASLHRGAATTWGVTLRRPAVFSQAWVVLLLEFFDRDVGGNRRPSVHCDRTQDIDRQLATAGVNFGNRGREAEFLRQGTGGSGWGPPLGRAPLTRGSWMVAGVGAREVRGSRTGDGVRVFLSRNNY